MFVVIKLFNYLCRGGHNFTLFICLSVSSFTQKLLTRSEYFTRDRDASLDKEVTIEFWKSLGFGSGSQNFSNKFLPLWNMGNSVNFADNAISCQILMFFEG